MEALTPTIPVECHEVLAHLWDYLDGNLNPDATASLRAHLCDCPPCRDHEQFQKSFLEAMASLRGRSAPEGVRERVIAALADAGFASTGRPWWARESTPSVALAGRFRRST
jgi:mycothiol system anti-sigma-R factor